MLLHLMMTDGRQLVYRFWLHWHVMVAVLLVVEVC
jgi:hypothetical protein